MLAFVRSATLRGVDGQVVTVEVHVSRGLPGYTVVGLPDAAGRESRERVRAALLSSALEWPMKRVTVNLAPADVRKTGSGLELAVAIALAGADDRLPAGVLDDFGVLGELGLDGRVRPVRGTLALVDALARAGVTRVVVPEANAREAALVPGVDVLVARTLGELHACLKGEAAVARASEPSPTTSRPEIDDDACRPRRRARAPARAPARSRSPRPARITSLFVGAAGRRQDDARPPPADDHAAARSRRSARSDQDPLRGRPRQPAAVSAGVRPFRAPHHSASTAALVGGGSPRPRPGEVSLAHRGALFLDELAEFPPSVLDAFRQPLEERVVRISRATGTIEFPADFLLIACSQPVPVRPSRADCRCSDVQRARYLRRLSAPLLDRFDLRMEVLRADADAPPARLRATSERSVVAAVGRQEHRLADTPWRRNAHVAGGAIDELPAGRTRCHRVLAQLCRAANGSAGAARRGSDGSRARSPTSTTAPTSPRPTSTSQ